MTVSRLAHLTAVPAPRRGAGTVRASVGTPSQTKENRMVNKPKSIGTAVETAVVRVARQHGFPNADRLTLTGNKDRGDIGLCPGVVVETKGGRAAETASDNLIQAWLVETETERLNAGAAQAFLVTKRAGVGASNAHRWHAWLRLGWLPGETDPRTAHMVVRMSLGNMLTVLRASGWGDPLAEPVEVEAVAS
ncbi:MAG TPA: hypothetical protein VIO38_09605 [Rariglobus sp.]